MSERENQDVVTRHGITGRFVERDFGVCEGCCFDDHCAGPEETPCNGFDRTDGKCGYFELVSSVTDMPNIPPPPTKRMKLCINCIHIIRRTDGSDSPRCGAIDRGVNPVDGTPLPRWWCETCRQSSSPDLCGRDGALFEARGPKGAKA